MQYQLNEKTFVDHWESIIALLVYSNFLNKKLFYLDLNLINYYLLLNFHFCYPTSILSLLLFILTKIIKFFINYLKIIIIFVLLYFKIE